MEYYNEEANTILAEEHNFTALLGNDWDRADFPGDTERKTNCLLYGKNTKNETVSDSEISEMETSSPEQESISSTQVEEESEATSSADSVLSIVEDKQVGREKDAIAILQIALKNKGKSLMEKLSDLQYQGIDGTYALKAGDYALKGQAVFYEIIENKRVELS